MAELKWIAQLTLAVMAGIALVNQGRRNGWV